jgi:hypothetical protein
MTTEEKGGIIQLIKELNETVDMEIKQFKKMNYEFTNIANNIYNETQGKKFAEAIAGLAKGMEQLNNLTLKLSNTLIDELLR